MPKEKIGTRKANGTGNPNKRHLWTEIVHQQCDLDLLQQEIQYGQRMMEKHKGHWRTMLTEIAMPQMRRDLEYSWSCYERAVENKDFMISILLDDLRMAEEQTLMCANVHMDNINYITVLCHDQIVELNQESIQLIRKLYTAGTFEVTYMQTTSQEHKEYMRMMLYILNEIGRETSKTMHGLSLTQEMLRKEKFLLVQQQLVDELTVRLRRMGAEIEAVLDHCIKQFEVRKKKYAEMERSDLEAQVVIRQNWERIHRCNESIKILQRRYAFLQSTQAKRIVDLRLEAAYFAKFFTALKQRVREELDMDGVAIRTLVAKSGKVIAALKAFEHRGEKLLKMVELCRKLETRQRAE